MNLFRTSWTSLFFVPFCFKRHIILRVFPDELRNASKSYTASQQALMLCNTYISIIEPVYVFTHISQGVRYYIKQLSHALGGSGCPLIPNQLHGATSCLRS
jgi:hypothetical protein